MDSNVTVNKFVWTALSTYFATVDTNMTSAAAYHFTKLYTACTHNTYTRAWLRCNRELLQRWEKLPVHIYELFLLLRLPDADDTDSESLLALSESSVNIAKDLPPPAERGVKHCNL